MTNRKTQPLRLCIVTNTAEYTMIRSTLMVDEPCSYELVHAINQIHNLVEHLPIGGYDALVLDYDLFTSRESLDSLKKCADFLPVIAFSSDILPNASAQIMPTGFQEFMGKKQLESDFLSRLIQNSIARYALVAQQKRDNLTQGHQWHELANLTELLVDGVLVVNNEKIIQYANHAAGVLLQQTNEMLVAHKFEYTINPDQATDISLIRTGNEQGFAEMRATPIVWNAEQSWLVSLRDITERKQIENELQQQAIHDNLTHLYTRQTFFTFMQEEFERSRRYQHSFSLLILDIDHFKQVNAKHGQPAGDLILRSLSNLLIAETRTIDRVCRFDGEKFALILPQTDSSGAMTIAERLCITTEASVFKINLQPVSITFSIGVATYPSNADSVKVLLAAAQSALYAAKKSGRNCVCRHSAGNTLEKYGVA